MLQRGASQYEATYQALLYGLLISYCNDYGIFCQAEQPAGKGFIDLLIIDKERAKVAIVEFKRLPKRAGKLPSDAEFDATTSGATSQILKHKHVTAQDCRRVVQCFAIGVACCGKNTRVQVRQLVSVDLPSLFFLPTKLVVASL